MGRRALRKISPAISLDRHLRSLEQLTAPLDFASLFGRQAPVELEVGSGKGLFLSRASADYPDRNFLGCEIAPRYARFAAARLARADRPNALVIEGDALKLCREMIAEQSLAAVHVYFPDPWWKKRHRKRRVFQPGFVRDVERLLEPGGSLHFWTDVKEYFQESLEIIAQETSLEGPLPVAERPAEHDLDYRTHFERRTRLHELPVYRAEFRKTSTGSATPASGTDVRTN